MMNVFYDAIILPIESVIEMVFCFFYYQLEDLGIGGAIVAVSLAVNFLALPLYNIADALQLKEREIQQKLAYRIKRIKQAFKGDERFMMLNTYYRENSYHPFYALRSTLSILIEIPFFIAAYHFLSHCAALNGQSFLFLKDLGSPDSFLTIGSFSLNVLPILMTAINCVSSAVYTKGAPLREKIQVYGLALIFLVLLYNSPSGLVFYWILNNAFSLCKNVVLKMKHPGRVVYFFICFVLLFVAFFVFVEYRFKSKVLLIYAVTILFILAPFIIKLFKMVASRFPNVKKLSSEGFVLSWGGVPLLVSSGLALCFLTGMLLPSSAIATSPTEFSFIGNVDSPVTYIISALSSFFGLFVIWPFCIYKMFGEKVKRVLPPMFFVLALFALANTFIFKYDYGTIDIFFKVENFEACTIKTPFFSVLPLLLLAVFIGLTVFAQRKNKIQILTLVAVIICLAEFSLSLSNIKKISTVFNEYKQKVMTSGSNSKEISPVFNLSKENKNVFVILLDRAISDYFPNILNQFPELKKTYSGFVFYPNCLSFGESTLSGSSALMGGYEYTPEEINKRPDELLMDKHNEAVLVMPKIFSDAGYNVVAADPPWMNYEEYFMPGNLFDDFKNTSAISLNTKFGSKYLFENKKDFPVMSSADVGCSLRAKHFSILQILYPPLRGTYYRRGKFYLSPEKTGVPWALNYYATLHYLPKLTEFDSEKPTFSFLFNKRHMITS